MTCIAAVAKNGKVWMGGDSASVSDDGDHDLVATEKVFKRGEFLYGFAGCWRTGQVLRHIFKEPARPNRKSLSDLDYLVGHWIDAWRELLATRGIHKTFETGASGQYATLLLGYRGTLYQIEQDHAVLTPRDGIFAIGSGSDFALGALHVMPSKPPALRVRMALQASERYSGSVRGPFTVLSL